MFRAKSNLNGKKQTKTRLIEWVLLLFKINLRLHLLFLSRSSNNLALIFEKKNFFLFFVLLFETCAY